MTQAACNRVLTTERLTLRRPEPRDVPALTEFYVSERSRYAGGNVVRPRAFSNACAVLGHWQARGYGLWAVTMTGDDKALGMVGPYYPDGWPETEFGWVLFDGAEGKGIALEAARVALADVRETHGWTDIVHYIARENARSIVLAEKLGAKLDPDAPQPKPESPCLVYRQPKMGGAA